MVHRIAIATLLFACLAPAAAADEPSASNDRPRRDDADRVEKLFASMRDGEYRSEKFPDLEWTDIPALLVLADSANPLTSFPRNPASSHAERRCSEGLSALWLIEGIRRGGNYPSLNAQSFAGRVAVDERQRVSEENRPAIAKLYRKWWDDVARLPADKARKVDPLEGSGLGWR